MFAHVLYKSTTLSRNCSNRGPRGRIPLQGQGTNQSVKAVLSRVDVVYLIHSCTCASTSKDYGIPLDLNDPSAKAGPLTTVL